MDSSPRRIWYTHPTYQRASNYQRRRRILTDFGFLIIFSEYGLMDVTVQEAIQDLITALIRSLGSSHGKLLTLMRQCPPGAESLALRVLTIFTEHSRPSSQLVALVKAFINERNLDARFLTPIIAEMDKVNNVLVSVCTYAHFFDLT